MNDLIKFKGDETIKVPTTKNYEIVIKGKSDVECIKIHPIGGFTIRIVEGEFGEPNVLQVIENAYVNVSIAYYKATNEVHGMVSWTKGYEKECSNDFPLPISNEGGFNDNGVAIRQFDINDVESITYRFID